jgi:hypothetical protein
MPTLADILNDAAIADATEFEINGVKGTIGDLRSVRGAAQKELTVAQSKRAEAERLALQAAELMAQLSNQPAIPVKQADGTIDWRKDPLYSPLTADIDKALAAAAKAQEVAETAAKNLDQARSVYAYRTLQAEWNAAPESFRQKNPFKDVAQQAIAAKEIDELGMPTLSRRIREATEPDRISESNKVAVEAARKQWETEQAAAAAKPSATGGRFHTVKNAEKPIQRIEDLNTEAIQNDPDIAAAIRGEQPVVH